jgi:hypothetical protein
MRIRLLGVGVKMGIVDGGHAQSDDVIRCPETFADHEYCTAFHMLRAMHLILNIIFIAKMARSLHPRMDYSY